MQHCGTPQTIGDSSNPEIEHRLASLQSLVCDLLQTNQQLRDALIAAESGLPRDPATHPSNASNPRQTR